MILLLADSSLDPYEQETKDAQKLIHKREPPSRKYTEHRGPKHDNRDNKIKQPDPDMEGCTVEQDPDMSLNYKNIGGSTKTSAEPKPDEKPDPKEAEYQSKFEQFKKELGSISKSLSADFDKYIRLSYRKLSPQDKIKKITEDRRKLADKSKEHRDIILKSDNPVDYVIDKWSGKEWDWIIRASLIRAVKLAKDGSNVSDEIKRALDKSGTSDIIEDRKLIQDIVKGSSKGKKKFNENDAVKFARLAALYREISNNPRNIESVKEEVDKASKSIYDKSMKLQDLNNIINTFHDSMSEMKKVDTEDSKHGLDTKKAMHSLRSFFGIGGERKMKIVHPTIFMDELIKDFETKYGDVPKELKAISEEAAKETAKLSKDTGESKEASNKALGFGNMAIKLAAYHGIKDTSGNPTDPTNTPYKSYDKRYFSEENWKSIIKTANELLGDDWFKFGWAGSPKDSRIRAALDVAIHLADSSLYQNKIDAETYNMLLNRLSEWGYDPFSETILPFKKGKTSSSKVASDLQQEGIKMGSQVQSLRTLISTGADLGISTSPIQTSPVQEQAAAVEEPAKDEPTEKKSPDAGDLDKEIQKYVRTNLRDKDIEEFIEKGKGDGFRDLKSLLEKIKRQASTRLATGQTAAEAVNIEEILRGLENNLSKIENMDDEQLNEVLKKDQVKNVEKRFDSAVDQEQDVSTLINYLHDLTKLITASVDPTDYVHIKLSTLIETAFKNPGTRPILLPIIITAAKKKLKKTKKSKGKKAPPKDKKTPPKGKKAPSKGKKPPFGGKKAPPFSKGKKAPDKGSAVKVEAPWMKESSAKKTSKSSVHIGSDDCDW